MAALEAGTLNLDFVEMSLTQDGSVHPIVYRGRGYLRQDSHKGFVLKLYAEETINTDMFAGWRERPGVTAGKLLPDTEYYSLQATCVDGTKWTAKRLLVDCDWLSGHSNPVVNSAVNVLESVSGWPGTEHFLRLHFFDNAELPYLSPIETTTPFGTQSTLGKATLQAGECDFEFIKDGDGFQISISCNATLPEDMPTVVEGGLGYALARSVRWRIAQHYGDKQLRTRLRALTDASTRGRLRPPVLVDIDKRQTYWAHLAKYLDHALNAETARRAASISIQLLSARESSAVSTEAWAMGVCLAVEGLSSFLNVRRSKEEVETLESFRANVLASISDDARFTKLRSRFGGLLGMLSNDRVQDRLLPLIASGHVLQGHLSSWKALRNRLFHPNYSDYRTYVEEDRQKLIDLTQSSIVLMYHIMFYLIGYEGSYVDYATPGYPTGTYPVRIDPGSEDTRIGE